MPIPRIRLLGGFKLSYGDAPVQGINAARLQSLLAFLLLHRDAPQSRQHIAFLFWPDADEMQARNNLRQMLHRLRHLWPECDGFLYGGTNALRWREDRPFSLDVLEFEQAAARAAEAEQSHAVDSRYAAWTEAIGLYRGDLLPSCYDEWIFPERDRLRQCYLGMVASLVRLLEGRYDYDAAIRYARDWCRHDPLAEDAHRALMRLLALTNDRAGALRVYQRCIAVLRRELGVEPSRQTRDLYQRLLRAEAPPMPIANSGRPLVGLPPMVGRRREWERLQSAWRQADSGKPCFVLVTGEAGIGKSRLAEELPAWASWHGVAVARARCYAAEGQLSLAPVIEWLRSAGLQSHLADLAPVWLAEISRILPEIRTKHEDLPRPEPIAEYGSRRRFFEALARAVPVASLPVMLFIDDLQWCDPETLEWLHFLLRFDPTARLLVIGTARSEELPAPHPLHAFLLQLGNTVEVAEIALDPLDAAETAKLAAQIMGHDLDIDAVLRLYRETEGNPLFVVETVREGIGQTHAGAAETTRFSPPISSGKPSLPPRVYTVIAGRLAQLSKSTRELVGLAAAVGRAFTLDILVRAGHVDEEDAVHALDELWNKRIVREHGAGSYDFTHDKLREVAYAEISAPQRRLLHRRIAQAFESTFAEDLDQVCGQIASHYEHAGLAEQAIPYYQRAAMVARQVYANDDAAGLLARGLALLQDVPAGRKRDTQELGLLMALAPTLRVMKGWVAPELARLLDRALTLCDKLGDAGQRAQVLIGLQSVYVVQARLEHVRHVAVELETHYQRSRGSMPLFAEVMLNGARLHLGQVSEANDRFAEIIAVYDPDQMQRVQEAHGVNYMVHSLAWQSHALWCLGYPRSALRRGHEAIQLARDFEQPFNEVLAAAYLALLVQLQADDAEAAARAEEALALAIEYKAPYYGAWSAILVEYARAWERPVAESIARLRDSITAFTATSALLRLPYYLSLLARVLGKAGRAKEGLSVLEEALAVAQAQNEHWWDAELYRLRSELLIGLDAEAPDAETALLQAIEIARSQQAKSLELRAARDLARLWGVGVRAGEARRLLADLSAWFREGLDTSDRRIVQSSRAGPP